MKAAARHSGVVWQRLERNAWAHAIDAALGDAALAAPPGADPFSLGDAELTARILRSAGFDDVHFDEAREPVFFGRDVDAALAAVSGFRNTSATLASLNDGEAARTVQRLREMLAAHHSHEHGAAFDSRSWLITARRRRQECERHTRGPRCPLSMPGGGRSTWAVAAVNGARRQ